MLQQLLLREKIRIRRELFWPGWPGIQCRDEIAARSKHFGKGFSCCSRSDGYQSSLANNEANNFIAFLPRHVTHIVSNTMFIDLATRERQQYPIDDGDDNCRVYYASRLKHGPVKADISI